MNLDLNKPSVIIVSSSYTKPKSIIKLITHHSTTESDPNIVSQEWEINTKYYTAKVNLHGITEDFVRSAEFNNCVEALIIHMDSNKESGLSDLDKWSNIENECEAEIKLLVANYFTADTKISKTDASTWCLKKGFELIELYPNPASTSEELEVDEIIPERKGVARIIEALETHVWPNLVMKEETPGSEKSENEFSNLGEKLNDFLMNDGVDDFTDLFSQLSMFKESLSSLSSSQRKQNAEQLVTKFWQAIGGEEEELVDV